ncbi:hypothetical protein [Microbacterium luticocti]|uniref:hypothetical protein n=1 Tax=Microbacterium luticocti TaxID=451764 RepID=UPI000412D890|nr:hypothetical protein [Microbacterium luticocti]
MGGQVLGGGVIVLVAVVLWLVYLLPSWYSRHQFDAAERNAVRLSQALRVLAETSEAPEEVRLELNARVALAQRKLARKAQAEREEAARRAQAEREALATRAQAETQALAKRAQRERERAELALRRAELERARAERAAMLRRPEVRRARARRWARLTVTVIGLGSLGLAGWGGFLFATGGTSAPLWAGGVTAVVSTLLLVRMARVGARTAMREGVVTVPARARVAGPIADIDLADARAWHPRELPRPLTASAGSRAAAVLDAAAEREQVRQAAMDAPLRERAAQAAPPTLDSARLARMGQVDDAEIEAHVRELLRTRAAG